MRLGLALLLAGLAAGAAAADEPPAPDPAALVRQLGHDDFRQREEKRRAAQKVRDDVCAQILDLRLDHAPVDAETVAKA